MRLLSSPPFSRFLQIGSRIVIALEISYNNPGSDFPNSQKKKVDAIRVCVFLSESPSDVGLPRAEKMVHFWRNPLLLVILDHFYDLVVVFHH